MSGNVAVVTGASRGLGRGIARALGSKGMTVYLTGRDSGALGDAAGEVTAEGGKGIAARCDHCDDVQVKALFERIADEAEKLDLLVNNAAAVHAQELSTPGPFWEKELPSPSTCRSSSPRAIISLPRWKGPLTWLPADLSLTCCRTASAKRRS